MGESLAGGLGESGVLNDSKERQRLSREGSADTGRRQCRSRGGSENTRRRQRLSREGSANAVRRRSPTRTRWRFAAARPAPAQHRRQRHQSLAVWQRQRKEWRCLSLPPAAAPQAKAPVLGRMAAAAQGVAAPLSERTCSRLISAWASRSVSGSAAVAILKLKAGPRSPVFTLFALEPSKTRGCHRTHDPCDARWAAAQPQRPVPT